MKTALPATTIRAPRRKRNDGASASNSSISGGPCERRMDLCRLPGGFVTCPAISEFRDRAGWPRRYAARPENQRTAADMYRRRRRPNTLQLMAFPREKWDFTKKQSIDLNGLQESIAMFPGIRKTTVQGQEHGEENNPCGGKSGHCHRRGGRRGDDGTGRSARRPREKPGGVAARPIHDDKPSHDRADRLCQILRQCRRPMCAHW